jgi:uncharacterized membrane protein
MSKNALHEIIHDRNVELNKLHELVQLFSKEEKLISTQLLDIESEPNLTFGQRMADAIATFGGSWGFIIVFLGVMAVWITLNTTHVRDFDPFPFILLNLALSCIAALQAPFIMMSQNRQNHKDRQRARSDFMINMKAEMEIRHLHKKIDLLIAQLKK